MKRVGDKNKNKRILRKEQEAERMIAPGIRVVRGPDWIWQNQGEAKVPSNKTTSLRGRAGERDKHGHKFKIISGSTGHACCETARGGSFANICRHFKFVL